MSIGCPLVSLVCKASVVVALMGDGGHLKGQFNQMSNKATLLKIVILPCRFWFGDISKSDYKGTTEVDYVLFVQ